jgi:hypothetical protein
MRIPATRNEPDSPERNGARADRLFDRVNGGDTSI